MSLRLTLLLMITMHMWASGALAQTVPDGYHVETIVGGLANPCAFDFLPDGRVLFTEQNTGFVRVMSAAGVVQPAIVIRVPGVVAGGERGLLGIAVDPRFPASPYVYGMFSTTNSRTRIARFELEGDLTGAGGDLLESPTAGRMDIRSNIPDNASNHNGGTLRFASDGTLIASVGDDAFPCGAQDSTGNRGVLLRLEVSRLPPGFTAPPVALLTPADNPYAASPDSNARLVLARGLRNPFRVQCDAEQPWIVIGDVGENLREELDLLALPSVGAGPVPIAMRRAGANFGWPYLEGTVTGSHASECGVAAPPGLGAPAFDYDRTQQGNASIIPVGFVNLSAGSPRALPVGLYCSDYFSGVLTRLGAAASDWQPMPALPGQPSASHFGEGFREISDWRVRNGELWFVRQAANFAPNTGSIGRVVADTVSGPPPPGSAPLTATLDRVPAVGQATIRISDGLRFPATLAIHDATGRVRRRFGDGDFGLLAGNYFIIWDGLDDDGSRAPAGVYWARLESAGRTVSVRMPFLR